MSFLKRLFGFGDKKPADIFLGASSPVVPRRNPMEIESTPEMIEEDLRFKARQMELLEVRMRDSGLYRIEKVPELMDKLSGKVPFARNSARSRTEYVSFGLRWFPVGVANASASATVRLLPGEMRSARSSPHPGASGSGTNSRTS